MSGFTVGFLCGVGSMFVFIVVCVLVCPAADVVERDFKSTKAPRLPR